MSFRVFAGLFTVTAFVLGFTGTARADIIAAAPKGTVTIKPAEPFALGWEFTVNQNISVTSLGAFDIKGDGHPSDQKLRIYNSTNDSVLVTAALGSSSTTETVDGYTVYFQSISPVTLTTGNSYIIAIDQAAGSDFMVSSADFGSAINYVKARATFFDGNLPNNVSGFTLDDSTGYFGANFKYNAVPEPGAITLLLTGVLALVAYAWRKCS